jgi:hypothetical protein
VIRWRSRQMEIGSFEAWRRGQRAGSILDATANWPCAFMRPILRLVRFSAIQARNSRSNILK